MRYVYFIVVIGNLEIKAQNILVLILWGRVVTDFLTSPIPPKFSLCLSSFWIKQHLHSIIVMRVILAKISDIEPVSDSSFCISHFEVKPLCVALRIVVWPHLQVILKISDLYCSFKVSTLKSGFKNQCHIALVCKHIVRINLSVVLVNIRYADREKAVYSVSSLIVSKICCCRMLEFAYCVLWPFKSLSEGVFLRLDLLWGI